MTEDFDDDSADNGRVPDDSPVLRDYPLIVTSERHAVITPIQREKKHFSGAVYNRSGDLVRHSQRLVGGGPGPLNRPHYEAEATLRHLEGRSLFGGILFRNFGHFLLEGVSRLWAANEASDRPTRVVYHAYTPDAGEALQSAKPGSYIAVLLRASGFRPDQVDVVVDSPAICEELIVPQSTFAISGYVHPRFVEVYDRVIEDLGLRDVEAVSGRRKVYLSRSLLRSKKRRASNEEEMEKLAVAAGYDIVHPQLMPFPEQVAMIRGAEVVAGCDGSALHLTVFSRTGTRVLCFDTRKSRTQPSIEAARGLVGVRVRALNAEPSKENKWGRIHTWEADLNVVRQALIQAS